MHDASVAPLVARGDVHRAPVVPDDQVAHLPVVQIDEAILRRERDQLVEQRAPLRLGKALDRLDEGRRSEALSFARER